MERKQETLGITLLTNQQEEPNVIILREEKKRNKNFPFFFLDEFFNSVFLFWKTNKNKTKKVLMRLIIVLV